MIDTDNTFVYDFGNVYYNGKIKEIENILDKNKSQIATILFERGRFKIPCKLGDKVYVIDNFFKGTYKEIEFSTYEDVLDNYFFFGHMFFTDLNICKKQMKYMKRHFGNYNPKYLL